MSLWMLLGLYPLIGLGLGIYYTVKFAKYDETWVAETGIFAVLALTLVWPYGWWIAHETSQESKTDHSKRKELEADALFLRVRREQEAERKRLHQEFDRELNGEPAWEKKHKELGHKVPERFSAGGFIPHPPTLTELNSGTNLRVIRHKGELVEEKAYLNRLRSGILDKNTKW